MDYLFIGCIALIFQYIFDLNKLFSIHRTLNIFYGISNILLAVATIGILLGDTAGFHIPIGLKIIFTILAAISLLLLIYSLFFALPFKKSYIDIKKTGLVDTGIWALSRHIWVVWFLMLYLFLGLASGKLIMLYADFIWTVFNIIHVYIQDRWIFPNTLAGYKQYQNEVPFLFPTRTSIRKCLRTFRLNS
jgi:protein-S-isoprenylcysteine O-methyltransferase Ste14